MKQFLCSIVAVCIFAGIASAQDSFSVRAQRYVQQYCKYAVSEQLRCGVPASVTLAQGILETEAGKSELACYANNHFGIKCKSDYTGPKYLHDDDAPKECFRMYKSAEESYRDHSDYLKRNPRYAPLFSLSATDYAGWAICLKKCGYATNPQYAQRLIKLIEDFHLQEYTYNALDSAAPKTYLSYAQTAEATPKQVIESKPTLSANVDTPIVQKPIAKDTIHVAAPFATVPATKVSDSSLIQETTTPPTLITKDVSKDIVYDSGKVLVLNGLKAFMAKKGEMLLQYALKYNVHYPKLLEFNDLSDGPLPNDMPIYLEKKLSSGSHIKHTVKEGENMLLIAQAEGIQLKRLMALNMLDYGEEPATGVILDLQKGAAHKPGLRATPPADLKTQNNLSYVKPTPKNDFLEIDHKPKTTDALPANPAKDINKDTYITTIALPKDTTVAPATLTTAADTPIQVADTVSDELAALKAELDKVVYADDSKLLPPPQNGKHEPVVISSSPNGPINEHTERTPKDKRKNAPSPSATYTIKKGDTISGIAKKNGVSVAQLMKLNHVKEHALRPGQKLRIK